MTRIGEDEAELRFWLVDVCGRGEVSETATHRVTLKL